MQLLPQFSLKSMLGITALCSVVSVVFTFAAHYRHQWAMGVSAAVAAVIFAFLLYAVFFGFAYWLATAVGALRRGVGVGENPFSPPRQISPSTQDTTE